LPFEGHQNKEAGAVSHKAVRILSKMKRGHEVIITKNGTKHYYCGAVHTYRVTVATDLKGILGSGKTNKGKFFA
jgi:hypothetical protein